MSSSPPGWHGITRRGFLLGAAAGLAAGVPLAWLAARRLPLIVPSPVSVPPETSNARASLSPSDMMPGRYPGRVIEIQDRRAVSRENVIDGKTVGDMVDRGMA